MIAMKARIHSLTFGIPATRSRSVSIRPPPFAVFIQRLARGAAKRGNRVRFRCTGGRASRFRVAGHADAHFTFFEIHADDDDDDTTVSTARN